MDDPRPQEGILAAGGVLELAHPIGAFQLSMSGWPNAPAERRLSVEAVMDVASAILCPAPGRAQIVGSDDVDAARAQEYSLLAMLLARSPDAAALSRIAELRGDATPLGRAHLALAQAAGSANAEIIEREFFSLFIGMGRGELLPYRSYFLTGFINERPLAPLREDLHPNGIERVEGQLEPEEHLAPWIDQFFADLKRAREADLYRRAGAIGRLYIETGTEAFTLHA